MMKKFYLTLRTINGGTYSCEYEETSLGHLMARIDTEISSGGKWFEIAYGPAVWIPRHNIEHIELKETE